MKWLQTAPLLHVLEIRMMSEVQAVEWAYKFPVKQALCGFRARCRHLRHQLGPSRQTHPVDNRAMGHRLYAR